MGQETLGGVCEYVEEMGISWGVWSWVIVRVYRVQGRKGPTCVCSWGFGEV